MREQSKINWRISYILIAFLFPTVTFSQDISGVWVGHIYNDTTHRNIHYELAINEVDGRASGYSHTTFVTDSVATVGVKTVKIKIKEDRIEVVDEKFIYDNFPTPPPQGVKMYSFLTLSQNDSAEVLSGNWMTSSTRIYNSVTGTIFLEKKKDKPDQTVIVAKLIQLGLGDKLSFLPPAIVSRDLIASNGKINSSRKTNAQNKEASTPSVSAHETVESQTAGNEKQKQSVARAVETNQVAISRPSENKKSNEPDDSVKKESSGDKKGNTAKTEDINQKQNAAKEQTPIKEQKSVAENAPSQAIEQQKNVVPETLNQKEIAALEPNQKNKPKEQISTSQEKKGTSNNLSNHPLAGSEAKKIDINESKENKKQEPGNETVKEQITSKIIDKNKQEVASNENENKGSAPPAAAEISKREIETIRTVDIVAKDSLQFSLYDNGTVDGDTVTVLINGKVVMPRVGLLERAINKTIYLTPDMGDSISVVMYAENLGSIPPNTGLLVIRDVNRIYEIRFSGDLKKNSAIILVRKKRA